MDYNLIVIGGGPAGILGAATAAASGLKVVLLEKNEKLGKKLFITGKGRCNFTNYGDLDNFLNNVTTNGKFLYSAYKSFDSHQTMGLMESLGVKIKVERGNRVFPASDKSSDVIKALHTHLLSNRVEIRLDTEVSRILVQKDQIAGVLL
ncbi:MAG: NAD(P)/FAD-dependent oxidoreductase, partial [Desulfocucumaceae bacterium]